MSFLLNFGFMRICSLYMEFGAKIYGDISATYYLIFFKST